MKKQEQEIINIAEKGGDDVDLFLLEKIHTVSDEIEILKQEQGKEGQIDAHVEKVAMKLAAKLATLEKGDQGSSGVDGNDGIDGVDGKDGRDGKDGSTGKEGKSGKDGLDGRDGRDGRDGVDGVNGQDGSPDTPDEIIEKINSSSLIIKKERIEGLVDALSNIFHGIGGSVAITTSFFNGLRAKNLTIVGATATQQGDTVFVTVPSSGGGGGGGGPFQQPTGIVNGTNKVFVFTTAPNIIAVDNGRVMQKVSSDGTVNWTGTTTVTLTIAPTFDIFGLPGTGFQQPTGAVNGTNLIFVFSTAPTSISVDNGRILQKVSSDGTINWTGTTTITLLIAPNFDIFGIS